MEAAIAVNTHTRVNALYFLIIGNPYEERQDLLDGVRLLEKLPPPFSLRAYNLVFLPGTELFDKAYQDGIIKGIDDSAFQIDFLAGLDPRTHEWKVNNLYLNSLMSLMIGKFTKLRMGMVPRGIIPILANPHVVEFCDRHTRISETIVALANLRLRIFNLNG
jgi:hypothetical protein